MILRLSAVRCLPRPPISSFSLLILTPLPSLQSLVTRQPRGSKARLALFGQFDPGLALASPGSRLRVQAIEDPYYGGRDGFDKCYEQCVAYARGFLDFLEAGAGDVPKF